MGTRPASLQTGQAIRAAVVDNGGKRLALGRAAAGRRQMLVFERGHWCATCRRHLGLMTEHVAEFTARNIDIVAITHEPESDLNGRVYPFPIIPDPSLELAAEFDVVGVDEFGKRTIRPATILVDDQGMIRFSYVGDDSRDRPTIPALLLALDTLI
ncbi:MAG TPA: redoxin domain-containing protein [Thermomicrobiales bacterium]|jgi:methyl-accepting chemotaxis protein|nr:redoxin domain-containing protein [Thermomicrobiales bacterium]